MLKAKTPLLVGLMVIIGAVAFVFTFGSLDRGMNMDNAYTVYARFDDATGLVTNSRVMLSGIEVGTLGEIALDPDFPALARVEIFLKENVKLREGIEDPETGVWKHGATAVRQQASLIGDYYVALSPGLEGTFIANGGMIRNATSSSGLGAVIKNLQDASAAIFPKLEGITDDIKSITGSLRETLGDDGAQEALQKIRADVSTTTGNVAALTGELRGFLKGSVYPRGENLDQIMANAQHTSEIVQRSTIKLAEQLDRILGRIEGATGTVASFIEAQTAGPEDAAPGTVGKAIAGLEKNLTILEGSLENVRAITANVEQGKGTIGRLFKDDTLITNIERVVNDVEDFTSTLSRTQIKVQFRGDYFVGRGAFKSTIDFSLHPAPDKYYLLQLVDDPAGKVSVRRRVTLSNDPLQPPALVEDITETSSDFKISAQFAKRFEFITFRYGIMESTGGIGIDADLLNDSLSFKLDVFEFGRDKYPNLRMLAQWEFMAHLFISAGIDDTLNEGSRDWFAGIGIRFTDHDLKGILPLVPSP